MKIAFTIEGPERIDIIVERNWFSGAFTCVANGQVHKLRSALNPATHINVSLNKQYEVEIGSPGSTRTITIEHKRPLMMAGLRPQEITVSVDGQQAAYQKGY